ncbi:MAG TPA: LamG-like jellyroll fold domain-containing protein [Anaerolineales bacterium]|nr:LamG-like jellyroll fold domain-containing protein [Anaerolineales bacterium]
MTEKKLSIQILMSLLAMVLSVGVGLLAQPVHAAVRPQIERVANLGGWTSNGYTPMNLPLPPSAESSQKTGLLAPEVCTPDTTNLVSYWPLDEAPAATIFEDVVGANEGGCTPPDCPTRKAGIQGKAREFANDALEIPNAPSLNWNNAEDFSIELWVKTSQLCTGNKVFVGKYRTVSIANGSWWVGCTENPAGDHVAAFNLRDTKQRKLLISGATPINDGAWHHIVAVRISGENKLYVDGVQVASEAKTYTGDFSSDGNFTFGTYTTGNQYDLFGTLDEVGIYNKALSLREILAHYNAGAGQSYCNDAPVAGDDTAGTDENLPVNIPKDDLLSNDTDVEASPLSISAFDSSSTKGGTVVESGANLTYTPPANFSGADTFTYTVTDGELSDTAVVTVTVGKGNELFFYLPITLRNTG